VKEKKKEKKVPEACIQQVRSVSYCGRDLPDNEVVFTDATYAVAHYTHSTTLRACPVCVDYVKELMGMRTSQLEPMATRGLKK
jgi:hypothetical protein